MIDIGDLIGKPFGWAGRGPNEYDCWGLCLEVYRRLGKPLRDYVEFCNEVYAYVKLEQEGERGTERALIEKKINDGKLGFLPIEKREPWCLVTFRIRGKYTSHIAIVLPNTNKFLHVLHGTRVCIESFSSPVWKDRVTGYYRCQ